MSSCGEAAAEAARAALFTELMQECKHSAPGARLSAKLRAQLESLCPGERRALCSRTAGGCAPLFVASRRGNVEALEYLVHVCGAELEQRGVHAAPGAPGAHAATPLWAAAAAGRLPALRALAAAGADLHARSDSGSTPVRSACFMSHLDVVRFLVAHGADVRRADHSGGTCLINAVQSPRLCALLLDAGAAVDARDVQLKTALHYAVQERRADTVRLLLARGADPRLASRAGDDALRTAALRGAAAELRLLLAAPGAPCRAARAADAYELLGATQLDELDDAGAALASWRRATALRARGAAYAPKRPARGALPALGGAREWRTPAELEAVAGDADALHVQALLVAERVLGAAHEDTLCRFMRRGIAEINAFRYRRCVDLWSWVLRVRVKRDSLLHADTAHTACALTRLLSDARAGRLPRAQGQPAHADVRRAFALLARALPACRRLLALRPQHWQQAAAFDRALRCATHLLLLLLDTAESAEQRAEAARRVRALVAADVRSAGTGDSLLHLCASRLNVVRCGYFAPAAAPPAFPSVRAVRALLRAGADALTRNKARCTPLHVAAIPHNFSAALVRALVAGGAHLDAPNRFGDSPAELVALNRDSRVRVLQHVTLACLAARALAALARAPEPAALPRTLHDFLDLHRP